MFHLPEPAYALSPILDRSDFIPLHRGRTCRGRRTAAGSEIRGIRGLCRLPRSGDQELEGFRSCPCLADTDAGTRRRKLRQRGVHLQGTDDPILPQGRRLFHRNQRRPREAGNLQGGRSRRHPAIAAVSGRDRTWKTAVLRCRLGSGQEGLVSPLCG